ncbi:hypothetical protein EYB25_009908 [Talaromyces marneffei]|uniref:uncharacterized protein n=1 Tax=Talaromyces marneffei TaxID=37727 RepID=UPI0012A83760|nr:uncharacterized protein EYB26_009172 [Talaromyces marneffei]KAE8548114.1 hypothetical protein EYB25_009908 [Talaromyces marneffei]QGA21461.1 hypothetical protein EYB26_009172 [Talaromyces marneffei]
MANKTTFYFYAPTWDYPPPPLGPLKLGTVFSNLKRPAESTLYTAQLPTSSATADNGGDSPAPYSTYKKDVELSTEKLRQGRFAILTQFLSVLGVGVDLGVDWDLNDDETLHFDTITTTQFHPSASYIQTHCVDASAQVQRWFERSRFKKPLYLITGIKIVSGDKSAETKTARGGGGDVSVNVDGTVWSAGAVPLGGGPSVEVHQTEKKGVKWGNGGDFVLAFRVKRFMVSKRGVKETDYVKGAVLGYDNAKEVEKNHALFVEEEDEFEIEGENPDWEGVRVSEGDEDVFVAVPRVHENED